MKGIVSLLKYLPVISSISWSVFLLGIKSGNEQGIVLCSRCFLISKGKIFSVSCGF